MSYSVHQLAGRWVEEVWNQRNVGSIHELMHPYAIGHTEGGDIAGPEAFIRNFHTPFLAAFPDLHVELRSLIVEGGHAAMRWQITGTHTGEFLGIAPTHRRIRFSGMTWLYFQDGKIAEGGDSWNLSGLIALLSEGTPSASVQLVYDSGSIAPG